MSLLDLILGQKIILLSAGFAVLVLLAAITLAVIPRIRRLAAHKARERAQARAAHVVSEQQDVQPATPAPTQTATQRKQIEAARTPSQAVANASAQPGQPPKKEMPVKPAEQPQAKRVTSEQPVAAMQDILSSVFQDDEALERYAVLLRGLDRVDIHELAQLSDQVASQLRAG